MSDAMEVYRWQEQSRKHLTERRPEPLDLSDREILDWLNEYMIGVTTGGGKFILDCEMISVTKDVSLRAAVKMAAAKLEEANL